MADIEDLIKISRTYLLSMLKDRNPNEEDISSAVKKMAEVMPIYSKNEVEAAIKVLEASQRIKMDLGVSIVEKETYRPWLNHRKSEINQYYWNRYSQYLLCECGWEQNVINSLSKVSDNILDLCGDPLQKGKWKRKGLVLGDIQSGKTSNYLALSNKAADAGYKVIIILTGTIEALRKQTQERVDAGFVGLNSRNILQRNPEKKYIGVGNIDCNRTAYQFTSVLSDFSQKKLESLNFTIAGLKEPVVLVIKKQKNVLENLATWLISRNIPHMGEKIDLPLLLIDDEADNASINTNKPEKDPTKINEGIVNILKLFNRSTYVAVTATPFANIFIDPELDKGEEDFNLFPSDFIYVLDPASHYIGSRRIFSDNADYSSALVSIDDVDVDPEQGVYMFRSKLGTKHCVTEIPETLKEAVRYFFLVNVIRDLDEARKSHRSMLINVSQYVSVQKQVYDLVEEYVNNIQISIQSYSKLSTKRALTNLDIKELYSTWEKFNLSYITGYEWKTIQDNLCASTTPITLRIVNQKSKERLDYEPYKTDGLRVIAIGGNALSRGLTLEGLVVSYFDRNSQMYDTLMQMGRWFGYRNGYDHLFKIWMEPDAIEWYRYITGAIDELREEINEMNRIGLTPREFGLKVQQNMTSLFVTARSKMRATTPVEKWISLSSKVIETPRLIADKTKCLERNLKTTIDLLELLLDEQEKYYKKEFNFDENRLVFTGVEKEIVAPYIQTFVSHPRHIPFNSKDLAEHISTSSEHKTWTVAIIGGGGNLLSEEYFPKSLTKYKIRMSKRVIIRNENCLLISGQRARVGVPGATKYGLTQNQISVIETKFNEKSPSKTIPDKPYLDTQRDPVLLVYIIEIDKDKKKGIFGKAKRKFDSDEASIRLIDDMPVIALGVGFPGSDTESKSVRYILNTIAAKDMLNFEDDEEDE